MSGATVDVETIADGTVVIRPRGVFDADNAVDLRRAIVHAVRRLRPLRLILDLRELRDLDAINLGTLAEACHLGDDQGVVVLLDHPTPAIAERLAVAGVAGHRVRHSTSAV